MLDTVEGSCSTTHKPFVEPLFPPSQLSVDDIRAVFIDAFLMTHYMHTKFPSVLQDTLSLRDLRFHRTASQETFCVIVDLDGNEHPSNPDGCPSTHGTIPFNAYDLILAPRPGSKPEEWDYNRPSLYTSCDDVNTAAPYKSYRHILEALFYMLLWCVSNEVPKQTLGWMERGHHSSHPLLSVLKHPKEREAFMWDASETFVQVQPEFATLIEAWLRPMWVLVSEAHFACRGRTGEERAEKLESMLAFNRIVKILRGDGGFDLRIATSIPVPREDSHEEL
ncbi:hypothetical protein MVEN_01057100 [Mycena venus]|uniref:Fungal-type protein kinase domain-containing protein n=1 Tax=Mycena venus TaxID=2733690 RepID=A0A8H6Y8D5_9AGAR|nr:hypothetical protein MVEN_01057100 [Mycena venus]